MLFCVNNRKLIINFRLTRINGLFVAINVKKPRDYLFTLIHRKFTLDKRLVIDFYKHYFGVGHCMDAMRCAGFHYHGISCL